MDDYVSKPIDPKDLFRKIDNWHGKGERQQKSEALGRQTRFSSRRKEGPPVDVEKALERAVGDKTFLEELLKHFTANVPGQIKTIKENLLREDTGNLEKGAHTLKGSAANMGADRIAALASRLEQMGRDGNLSDGGRVLHELTEELDSLRTFMNKPGWLDVKG